jgi:hypothetical protein
MRRDELKILVEEMKEALGQALKDKMSALILFGSYARGDYSEESDLDFILLLNERITREEDEKITEISSRLSLKYDTVISCLDYLKEDFETRTSPLTLNVKKEGIRI